MKKALLATAVAISLSAGVASADADLSNGVTLSGSSTITSNYVWRGMTQSNDEPAIQGGVELSVGNLYGSAWMPSMDASVTHSNFTAEIGNTNGATDETNISWYISVAF